MKLSQIHPRSRQNFNGSFSEEKEKMLEISN
jgi:hypothetical protein